MDALVEIYELCLAMMPPVQKGLSTIDLETNNSKCELLIFY